MYKWLTLIFISITIAILSGTQAQATLYPKPKHGNGHLRKTQIKKAPFRHEMVIQKRRHLRRKTALVRPRSPLSCHIPFELRASTAEERLMNQESDAEGLSIIGSDETIVRMRTEHALVGFSDTPMIEVDPDVPEFRRYAFAYVKDFVDDYAAEFTVVFPHSQRRVKLDSFARSQPFQRDLRKRNRNAAPFEGPFASSHLRANTVDISTLYMTPEELEWSRRYMIRKKKEGRILPFEECGQRCFHVMVRRPKEGQTIVRL